MQGLTLWDELDLLDMRSPGFVRRATGRKLLFIRGWLYRDQMSFEKHADTIRGFFTPVGRNQDNVNDVLRDARARIDILVGIHIRQGDIVQWKLGDYLFDTAQYVGVMQRVQRSLEGKRVGFLVCSNIEQARDLFDGLEVTFGTGHIVEDLYALAGCDYIVGPPSTYSMWASFYGSVPLHLLRDTGSPIALEAARPYTRDFEFVDQVVRTVQLHA